MKIEYLFAAALVLIIGATGIGLMIYGNPALVIGYGIFKLAEALDKDINDSKKED